MKSFLTFFRLGFPLAFLAALPLHAAQSLRLQLEQRGDILLIGNTLGQDGRAGVPAPLVGTANFSGAGTLTDDCPDIHWRADLTNAVANASIIPDTARSTAVLSLPPGASVTRAFLYWSGDGTADTFDPAATLERPGVTFTNAQALAGYILASNRRYESVADVTPFVRTHGSGAYRVSGVHSENFVGGNDRDVYAGWVLVVFYERDADPFRNLALFDGFDSVGGNSVDIPFGGFRVPPGVGQAKLGVVAYEGDENLTGDQMLFGPNAASLTVLSDTNNPANDFFNNTHTILGQPGPRPGDLPRLTGTAGSMGSFDFDVVDVSGLMTAGQTNALIRATSSGDQFELGLVFTSVESLEPDFNQSLKRAFDINGAPLRVGDLLQYTLVITNTGNDAATNVVVTDPLPLSLTYAPNSITVQGANAGPKTDAPGDDQAEFDFLSRTLTVRLGSGANATRGGLIPIFGQSIVRFNATINTNAPLSLTNQAFISAAGVAGDPVSTTATGDQMPGSPTITPVLANRSPALLLPGPQILTEDSPFAFTNAIAPRTFDPDGPATLVLTLTAAPGTGTLSVNAGAGVSISGNGSSSLQLTGTTNALNTRLTSLRFLPASNYDGPSSLTLVANDLGYLGAGGPLSTTGSVALTILPRAGAPQNNLPAPQSTPEDVVLLFTNAASLSISDSGTVTLNLQIPAGAGLLAVNPGPGVTLSGNGSTNLTLSGSVAQLNSVLASLRYQPALNFNGTFNLRVDSFDGALRDIDFLPITVVPDTAPINVVPGPQVIDNDEPFPFTPPRHFSIIDDGSTPLTVTLSVPNASPQWGTFNVPTLPGVSVTGNDTRTLVLTGPVALVNQLLASLVFNPVDNKTGTANITINTTDGTFSDIDTVSITLTNTNNTPTNTVPGTQTIAEDTPLPFNAANGNPISVSDAANTTFEVNLAIPPGAGTLTVAPTPGVTVLGSGTNLTLVGAQAAVNAALATLVYTPTPDFSGSTSLTVTTSDGQRTDIDSVTINILPADDPPTLSLPGAQIIPQGGLLALTNNPARHISVDDPDGGSLSVTLSIPPGSGALFVNPGGGTTLSGNGSTNLTLTGTLAQLNATLASARFVPAPTRTGPIALIVTANDGSFLDTGTIPVHIAPAPINTVPGAQVTVPGNPIPFNGANTINIDAPEAGANPVQVTIALPPGTGILQVFGVPGVSVTGNGTGTLVIQGPQSLVDQVLASLVYTPAPGLQNTTFNITVTSNDLGNNSAGTPLTDTDTIPVTILGNGGTATAGTATAGTATAGTATAGTATAGTATAGTATAGTATAGTATAGTATAGTATAGTASAGTASAGTASAGTASAGTASAGTATGGSNAQGPTNHMPGPQSTSVGTPLALSGTNAISVSAPEAGKNPIRLTLSVPPGLATLSVSNLAGVVVIGNGGGTLVLEGSVSDLNAILQTLVVTPAPGLNDVIVPLTLTSNDLGNNSSGSPLSDTDSLRITIPPSGDGTATGGTATGGTATGGTATGGGTGSGPSNSVPGPQTVEQGATLAFTNDIAIAVAAPDAGTNAIQVTVSVPPGLGTLTVTTTNGVQIIGDGTGTLIIQGPPDLVNEALATLLFIPEPSLVDVIVPVTVTSNDLGNNPGGTPLIDSDTIDVSIVPVGSGATSAGGTTAGGTGGDSATGGDSSTAGTATAGTATAGTATAGTATAGTATAGTATAGTATAGTDTSSGSTTSGQTGDGSTGGGSGRSGVVWADVDHNGFADLLIQTLKGPVQYVPFENGGPREGTAAAPVDLVNLVPTWKRFRVRAFGLLTGTNANDLVIQRGKRVTLLLGQAGYTNETVYSLMPRGHRIVGTGEWGEGTNRAPVIFTRRGNRMLAVMDAFTNNPVATPLEAATVYAGFSNRVLAGELRGYRPVGLANALHDDGRNDVIWQRRDAIKILPFPYTNALTSTNLTVGSRKHRVAAVGQFTTNSWSLLSRRGRVPIFVDDSTTPAYTVPRKFRIVGPN